MKVGRNLGQPDYPTRVLVSGNRYWECGHAGEGTYFEEGCRRRSLQRSWTKWMEKVAWICRKGQPNMRDKSTIEGGIPWSLT